MCVLLYASPCSLLHLKFFQVVLDRVNPGEWSRFQYYASLVRCCHINEVDPRAKAVVDHTVFAYLLRKNKGRPLLPFLEHLAWYQVRSSDLSLSSLATPSLRKLQCYVSPPSRYFSLAAGAQSAVDSLLGNVLGYAGQLHELSVIGLSRWCTLESPKKCLQLRALHGLMLHPCSTPTSAELATLARIPALQYLHLYFDESILKKKKTGGGGEMCTFRHLERLKFTGYTLGMTAFLNNSALPALESLVISLFTFVKLQQVHNLLHSVRLAEVAPRLRHLTLKKEHLQLEFDYPDEADGTPLLAILDPLFALPCLHRLEISLADMSIRVSDDDVLSITSQLKELRVLVLDIPKTPLATRPSLLALVHVARNCRHLHNLRLPPVVHRGGAPPVNDLPPHELSALDTGHWDVDSVSLNAFLTTLFPKLKL